jgi:hypothetical protein
MILMILFIVSWKNVCPEAEDFSFCSMPVSTKVETAGALFPDLSLTAAYSYIQLAGFQHIPSASNP